MTKIVISVTNDLISDQRVQKIASSLSKSGVEIIIAGRKLNNSPSFHSPLFRTKRFKLLFKKGFLFYANYNIRLFFFLLFSNFDALVSNDLDTLPANYLISVLRRKILVYDSHELFTEVPELIYRKRVQGIWKKIEKSILPRIRHCYTVSSSIAQYYNKLYNINMEVIRNVPVRLGLNTGKGQIIDLPAKKMIIYQGSLNAGRGLEKLIRTMHFLDNILLLLVGDGDVRIQLQQMVQGERLENKVLFTGRLTYDQMRLYTKIYSLGLSLEENMGLSYYYSLPNKLFDYIQSEIPVLASDFPELSNIINNYNIGAVTGETKPSSLATIIKDMLFDEPKNLMWKANLKQAAEELCWKKKNENSCPYT